MQSIFIVSVMGIQELIGKCGLKDNRSRNLVAPLYGYPRKNFDQTLGGIPGYQGFLISHQASLHLYLLDYQRPMLDDQALKVQNKNIGHLPRHLSRHVRAPRVPRSMTFMLPGHFCHWVKIPRKSITKELIPCLKILRILRVGLVCKQLCHRLLSRLKSTLLCSQSHIRSHFINPFHKKILHRCLDRLSI